MTENNVVVSTSASALGTPSRRVRLSRVLFVFFAVLGIRIREKRSSSFNKLPGEFSYELFRVSASLSDRRLETVAGIVNLRNLLDSVGRAGSTSRNIQSCYIDELLSDRNSCSKESICMYVYLAFFNE